MKSDYFEFLSKSLLVAAQLSVGSIAINAQAESQRGALSILQYATLTAPSTDARSIPSMGRSMPQVEVESTKAAVIERFIGGAGSAYRIDLAPWKGPETASAAKSVSAESRQLKPTQIGYPREIPAELRALPLAALGWTTQSDGSRTAHVQVVTADAAGLRIAYRIQGPASGLELRFTGSGRDQVFRSDASPSTETAWSPVLEGNTATVELRVLPSADPTQFNVTLEGLSHLVVAGADLRKDARDITSSGSCNIDIACVTNPSSALLNIAKATAKMVVTDGGNTFLCTGTLLNSTSGADYFFSASQCVSNQAAASTLNTYWFFDAIACNSVSTPPFQMVAGGATLLVNDPTLDVALLQMRQPPPAGAVRSAWNATVVPAGTSAVTLHHPQGDLKKFSQGNALGYVQGPVAFDGQPRPQALRDSYISVRWSSGTTEAGSTGAGLFTLNSAGGFYELRGGLEGGVASCSNPSGLDRFSRMDLLFTKLAPFLQPSAVIPATTSVQATMVEYFNPQFNFYWMTTRESDKNALDTFRDSQANPLWYRTGYSFKTEPTMSPGTSAITRYFIPGAARNGTRGSSFYTALDADKLAITNSGKERFSPISCIDVPDRFFCNEGIDSFIALPVGVGAAAACLPGQQPIWRAFRSRPADDGNHRYLTNRAMYDYMVNEMGWDGEFINFCAKP